MQDFLFPGGKENFFPGFLSVLIHGQWIQDLFIQNVTAFNRFVMVVYPKMSFIFSRKVTIQIIIFVYILGFSISLFGNYILPCCKIYIYYATFSYTILDTGYNYLNTFIAIPINIVASLIPVVIYTTVSFCHRNCLFHESLDVHLYTHVEQKDNKCDRQIHAANEEISRVQIYLPIHPVYCILYCKLGQYENISVCQYSQESYIHSKCYIPNTSCCNQLRWLPNI